MQSFGMLTRSCSRPIVGYYKCNKQLAMRLSSEVSNVTDVVPQDPAKDVVLKQISLKIPVPKDFSVKKYNKLPHPTFNLAAYADSAPVLQKLIEIGVEIYKFDSKRDVCEKLMQSDFDRDLKPYLRFLLTAGIPASSLGNYITKNPYIFMCDLEDLEVRLNYLQSKKFGSEMIVRIITKEPTWLSFPVAKVDKRLGYIQNLLNLSGSQVRSVIVSCPRLIRVSDKNLLLNVHAIKEQVGVGVDVRETVLKLPSILTKNPNDIVRSCYYLQNVMNVPLDLILKQPLALATRSHLLRERHTFLVKLGRAQYNPDMPGYVSLERFVKVSDEEFCREIAMASVETYHNFLKLS